MKLITTAALYVAAMQGARALPEQPEALSFQPFDLQQQQEGPEPVIDPELVTEMKGAAKTFKEKAQQFDELHKDSKKAIEELTLIKTDFKGMGADLQAVSVALKRVELQMARERRMAFGDPIERIVQDEEKRTLFNAIVRKALRAKYPEMPMNDAQKRALDTSATPGSTYINAALERDVYDVLATYGIWNSFEVRQLSTKTTKMPVKTVRPVATYLTENTPLTPDTNKGGTTVSATVASAGVLVSVSEELLQDSEIDITADLLDDFGQAISFKMDYAALQADGDADATDGGFTGIFGGGGTAVNAASGNTTMETLDFEDVNGVVIASSDIASRGLKWWMHPQILARCLHIKDGNNRPIFLTALEAPAVGNIGSILGYPTVIAQQAPSTNSASAKVMVLGDPRGARFGIRKDFEFRASDQFGFDEYAIYFRGISRHAFKIKAATAFRVLTLPAS